MWHSTHKKAVKEPKNLKATCCVERPTFYIEKNHFFFPLLCRSFQMCLFLYTRDSKTEKKNYLNIPLVYRIILLLILSSPF